MKKTLLPFLIIILIGLSITAFLMYKKAKEIELAGPNASSQDNAQQLLNKIRALIVLPEGEIPTIATVSDLEKLKDQPFFAKAKLGDKVLLYPKAKRAYLYDVVNNKILEVAPLDLGTETLTNTQNTTVNTSTETTKLPSTIKTKK